MRFRVLWRQMAPWPAGQDWRASSARWPRTVTGREATAAASQIMEQLLQKPYWTSKQRICDLFWMCLEIRCSTFGVCLNRACPGRPPRRWPRTVTGPGASVAPVKTTERLPQRLCWMWKQRISDQGALNAPVYLQPPAVIAAGVHTQFWCCFVASRIGVLLVFSCSLRSGSWSAPGNQGMYGARRSACFGQPDGG